MFERVDQTQKEKRARKSQLYKEMLDNQILMNRHYKESQLARAKANIFNKGNQERTKHDPIMSKKIAMIKKMKQRNLEENGIMLPSIAAEPRYYRGHSRYRSIDQGQTRNFATNIVHTQIDQQSSSQSEVQEIIKQMQLINQKINQNNRKRSRRMVTTRQPRQTINTKRQRMISTLELHQDNNPQHNYARYKSKSIGLRQDKKDNNLNQKLQQMRTINNQDHLSLQSVRKDSFVDRSKKERSIQKSEQMKKQRQKFMTILKKVNKRGKNLLLRVSNFPSPKTQFIDPHDD